MRLKVRNRSVISRYERAYTRSLRLGDDSAIVGIWVMGLKLASAAGEDARWGLNGRIVQEDPGCLLMAEVWRWISNPVVLGFDDGNDPELDVTVEVSADHGDALGLKDRSVVDRTVPELDRLYEVGQRIRIDGDEIVHQFCSGAALRIDVHRPAKALTGPDPVDTVCRKAALKVI